MPSVIIKSVFILVTGVVWLALTYWVWSSIIQVYRVRNVDATLTLQLIGKAIIPGNPFATFAERIRERAEL